MCVLRPVWPCPELIQPNQNGGWWWQQEPAQNKQHKRVCVLRPQCNHALILSSHTRMGGDGGSESLHKTSSIRECVCPTTSVTMPWTHPATQKWGVMMAARACAEYQQNRVCYLTTALRCWAPSRKRQAHSEIIMVMAVRAYTRRHQLSTCSSTAVFQVSNTHCPTEAATLVIVVVAMEARAYERKD